MEIDLNQPAAKLLRLIKPSFFEYYGSDAPREWAGLVAQSKGPGGSDRVRDYITDHDGFAPFNKGGLAKKKTTKTKMAKGGSVKKGHTDRRKDMFYK